MSSRHYYLHLYNDTCISGAKWGALRDEEEDAREEDEVEEGEEERKEKKKPSIYATNEELRIRLWLGDTEAEEGQQVEEEEGEGEEGGSKKGKEKKAIVAQGVDSKAAFRVRTLNEIIARHEKMGGGRRAGYYALAGRVISSTKVNHYPKASDSGGKANYPFNANFILGRHIISLSLICDSFLHQQCHFL